MRRSPPLTTDAFLAELNACGAEELADLDAMMDLGRRAAAHPWAVDVLADWLDDQPATPQAVDVARGVLAGFRIEGRAEPPRVIASLIDRARTLGAAGLRHAANGAAFIAVRALRDPARSPELRRAAREVLEDLVAHADHQSLQSVARAAAMKALANDPGP